jgi:hypothetical protein
MKYTNTILNFKYKNIPIMIGNLLHFGKWPSHTHTAFALFEDDKGVFVVEAGEEIIGTYYEKWWLDNMYKDGKLSVGKVEVDNKLALSFFQEHEGDPYSYMNLLDIVRYWFLGKTDVLDTKDDWICSEFVAELIRYASKDKIDFVKELKLPKDDFMSPEDFMLSKQITWIN